MEEKARKIKTEIKRVDPKSLTFLEENARYMTHEQFVRLVDNVKEDGCLTSAPFVWWNKKTDQYVIMSGNHRTKAAIEAGLSEIDIILTRDELTESQRIAIQISHNTITGQDDTSTLKNLYEKILDMDMREYCGVDDKTLDLLKDVKPISIGESNLEFQTLTLMFLPNEMKEAEKAIDEALKIIKSDKILLARFSEYDKWLDSIEAASNAHGIKNAATAIMVILDIFSRNITDLSSGWDHPEVNKKARVPISSITGTDRVIVESAKIISRACDKAVCKDEIKKEDKWKFIERLCSEYIDRN